MGEHMIRAQIPPELHDRDWLVERLDEGATTREIAVAAGTHRQLVERALRSHGLHYVRAPRQLLDIEWLIEQRSTLSVTSIAAELETSIDTVRKYLRRAGL
jgi:hypothetical protein